MTKIPEAERTIMEQAIYLPMVLTILHRDLSIIQHAAFKLKQPYVDLIEETILTVQKELKEAKQYLRANNLHVTEATRDDAFTRYLFFYKGYKEEHHYFNPRIRNKVQELMEYYLSKRYAYEKRA
ncbi:hypothetical protein J9303_04040 [Bacillaceae bacterium Marseille-Q3522]|nr:hypothetical protein [Bacillaceae bacterium Marseille-Q3522]